MKKFTHLDTEGKAVMVNVSQKKPTLRTATARAVVVLPTAVLKLMEQGDLHTKKGPVFQTAVLAGIMAAKKTGELIPLCHPLGLEDCRIEISWNENREVVIDCTTVIEAKTGVEMEAMVGASIAALTLYDMCKAVSPDITVKEIRLIEKKGGKHDFTRT